MKLQRTILIDVKVFIKKNMKKLFLGMLVFSGLMVYSCNNKINEPVIVDKDTVPTIPIDPSYNIDINDFLMRDPFALLTQSVKNTIFMVMPPITKPFMCMKVRI